MSKRSRKGLEPIVSRKQLSRQAKEEKQRRWVLIGVAGLAALLVIVGLAGAYQELVAKPSRPVALVRGEAITLGAYRSRVALQKFLLEDQLEMLEARQRANPDSQLAQLIAYISDQLENVASVVYDELIDEAIIRQEASKLGLSVSPDQVTMAIEEGWGYSRNPLASSPGVTGTTSTEPSKTLEEFQGQYGEFLSRLKESAGVGEEAYREMVEANLLRNQLMGLVTEDIPTTEEAVHARHILASTREKAEEALGRLRAGESFTEVAKEISVDPGTKENGGDLGWFGRGQMIPSFEEAVFSLEPGQLSEVITSTFGYHVIRVDERDPSHAISPQELAQRKANAFREWLKERREEVGVERLYADEQLRALVLGPDEG